MRRRAFQHRHLWKSQKLNPGREKPYCEIMVKIRSKSFEFYCVDTRDDGSISVNLNNRNIPELRMSRLHRNGRGAYTKTEPINLKNPKKQWYWKQKWMLPRDLSIFCSKATSEYINIHHAGYYRPATPFLFLKGRIIASALILKDGLNVRDWYLNHITC